MRYLIPVVILVVCLGCGNPFEFDPATTVILKVTGVDGEAESDRIKDKATELVMEESSWQKHSMSRHAETLMIKVSPVEDPQGYAGRITFGKVTAIDGNIIHLQVGENEKGL